MVFLLVHSPLVGPGTWAPVAAELRRRGFDVVVPSLETGVRPGTPYWRQHADAAARGLHQAPPDRPPVLVGHSGAGPLLPAIRLAAGRPVAAYIFVDAGIPRDGASRLDLMALEDPQFGEQLRLYLVSGGRFPEWKEADLRELIPVTDLRNGLVDELHPRPLQFFAEPIPVFDGWPDAPCGYLQFSSAYAQPAAWAREAGWAYRAMEAGHFHMLVDPAAVADALVELHRDTAGAGGHR